MSWLFRLVRHREVIKFANALDIADFFAYRKHITPVLEYGYNSGQCPTVPKEFRKTLTRDRGSENLGYMELERTLGIRCFFAHAYHAWERGSNENANGLIRRFFPKGTDFRTVSDEEIQRVEYLLNTRPRKRLGWKTPYEVFYEATGVALQS